MADSVDRVFGHALNTVNKIRPGSQKPPSGDRLALYGLYKQSMEGDVALIADRPTQGDEANTSTEHVKKEQEKWDAWKANEGTSRTEAKRRYISKLIDTMHKYASTTPEARELVEELEFVWDQIKNNSQNHSSGSDHSSPLQNIERSGYIQNGSSGAVTSSAAALEGATGNGQDNGGPEPPRVGRPQPMRVLSPVSQADEEELLEEEREEFVDAPVSQVDEGELQDISEGAGEDETADVAVQATEPRRIIPSQSDNRWRRKIESSLIKLTTEVAALREMLEYKRDDRNKRTLFGWILRLSWWAAQVLMADAVILWIVILYLRRKDDRRLEGAVRVLLGDAVAQVQKVGREVRRVGGRKQQS